VSAVAARRVVIADDEPLARERLRMLLARRPEYRVVAECENGVQAVEAIAAERPDIVFLDIKMPALDGLEVVQALSEQDPGGAEGPAVVFVTAFDEFAVRAFEVNALDYLLKPVDRPRLDRALERAEHRLTRAGGGLDPAMLAFLETLRAERGLPSRFLVRGKGELYFVRADSIDWADAQGNYVRLHAEGRAHLVRDTLKAFEAKLDPAKFVRIHRSAIVNIERVVRIEPYVNGEYVVTLRDGARLTTSRTHGARLHELLR
jgi:two-component system, LytTR family, response regulator